MVEVAPVSEPGLFPLSDGGVKTASGRGRRRADPETGQSMYVYLIDAWQERAMLGGRRKLAVKAFMSVREVKCAIGRLLGIRASRQRLYWRSVELRDHRTLEESGVHESGATLVFDARPADETGSTADEGCYAAFSTRQPVVDETRRMAGRPPASPSKLRIGQPTSPSLEPVSCAALHGSPGALPPAVSRSLLKARRGLVLGSKAPELAMEGTGGTYFLYDLHGRPVACFKPADEEPFCVNNPRHFVGPYGGSATSSFDRGSVEPLAMRRGVRPGEAYVREVAAYLLDRRGARLAGVPETTLVECRHAKFRYVDRNLVDKVGSFQVFVEHDGIAEDYGLDRLDAARLQAIAALDIRALNCDRNPANILVSGGRKSMDLVPVDHGYCLPDVLEIEWFEWCWIDWPQLAAPVCDAVKRALSLIDPAADAAMLRDALGIRPACLRLARSSTELLKRGVAAGLTLRDVAELVVVPQHDGFGKPSKSRLADAIERAADLARLALDEDRHPGRQRTASPDRDLGLFRGPDKHFANANYSEATAAKADMHYSEAKDQLTVHISISSSVTDDRREDKKTAERTASAPIDLVTTAVWEPPQAGDGLTGTSPRWVDGLPAAVASRNRCASKESSFCGDSSGLDDEDDSDDAFSSVGDPKSGGLSPSLRTRRRRVPGGPVQKSSPDKPGGRQRHFASPLVRLHSCPALADVASSAVEDPPRLSALEEKTKNKLRDADDAAYDRHFFHFLNGILDDLVRWKLKTKYRVHAASSL